MLRIFSPSCMVGSFSMFNYYSANRFFLQVGVLCNQGGGGKPLLLTGIVHTCVCPIVHTHPHDRPTWLDPCHRPPQPLVIPGRHNVCPPPSCESSKRSILFGEKICALVRAVFHLHVTFTIPKILLAWFRRNRGDQEGRRLSRTQRCIIACDRRAVPGPTPQCVLPESSIRRAGTCPGENPTGPLLVTNHGPGASKAQVP
jgi:hypothetical protein